MGKSRFDSVNFLFFIPAVLGLLWFGYSDFLWREAILLALILPLAFAARNRWTTARPPAWCAPLRRWSRNIFAACAIPAIASIVLRLILLPWIPVPHPVVPDEFSHLFLAKTLLLGRFANPPHPLWQHFETIHVISQPTFSSMYMMGQACFLAFGKLVAGDFFAGVLLSTALFCAALTWFLRAYVPPGWALFGGLLAAVRIGAASYWNNSYWGGSAAALGGALMFGAYARITSRLSIRNAVLFTLGTILVANTRPYEGFGLATVLIGALLIQVVKRRSKVPWRTARASIASAAILAAIAGWVMTSQWKAVTGSRFMMPYTVNYRTYGWPLTLPFTKVKEVSYAHPEFKVYHDFELDEHRKLTSLRLFSWDALFKLIFLWRFYLGIACSATITFADRILSVRRTRVIWFAMLINLVQVITEQSSYPHYLATATAPIFLFIVQGFRRLMQCSPKRFPLGPFAVFSAIPLMLIVLVFRAAMSPQTAPAGLSNFISWCCNDARLYDRYPLVESVAAQPGKHLVIIGYDTATYKFDWVYNEPDIDGARIIFARDMGPVANHQLITMYPDRRVWKVRVENQKPAILYDSGASTASK